MTVTWSEAIDSASARSDAAGFVLRYEGSERPAVTAVAVDGTDATLVRLTVDATIPDGTTDATLAWSVPGSGVPIRDLAGNVAAPFTASADRKSVEVTPDTTAPTVTAAAIDGAVLSLTFDEPLDEGSVPAAPGGFTVTVTRDGSTVSGHTVTGIEVEGDTVRLGLALGVLPGDAVVLAYAPPGTNPLRDRAVTPNNVAAFTTGAGGVPAISNLTGMLDVSLSKTEVTEGEDRTVTLTVALPEGMAGTAGRTIAVAPSGTPTAVETDDWTLDAASKTLEAGAQSIGFEITVVDDATLEGDESVTFAVTANGAPAGTATLPIADDDRAVLTVTGPTDTQGEAIPVIEGGTGFTLKLRLDPDPANGGPPLADDACFLDFAVAATLAIASGAEELADTPAFPVAVAFPATSLDDCTREVEVNLTTRASDGIWHPDREVQFSLERDAGQDERVDPGTGTVTVRDDTPVPGPLVTAIEIGPLPESPDHEERDYWIKELFDALPDEAVHGPGKQLAFTLTFDKPVTVTLDPQRRAMPALALDVFGRTRLAGYTGTVGSPVQTMAFRWTVARGDYDPDGIAVRGLVLNGATILDAEGRPTPPDRFPVEHVRSMRVRGGYWTTQIKVPGSAREGEAFTIEAIRDGDDHERAFASVEVEDSAVGAKQYVVEFQPKGSELDDGTIANGLRGFFTFTPPPDGLPDPDGTRTMTIRLHDTEASRVGAAGSVWYEATGTLEVTVKVADNELPADAPVLAVGPADVHEPETGTVPLKFRVCLWTEGKLCPDAGKDPEFEAHVGASHQVTVDYTTSDGTATAGQDYRGDERDARVRARGDGEDRRGPGARRRPRRGDRDRVAGALQPGRGDTGKVAKFRPDPQPGSDPRGVDHPLRSNGGEPDRRGPHPAPGRGRGAAGDGGGDEPPWRRRAGRDARGADPGAPRLGRADPPGRGDPDPDRARAPHRKLVPPLDGQARGRPHGHGLGAGVGRGI